MSNEERADFKTRFKKGQSGNPRGRPKKRKNKTGQLLEALYRPIPVKDGRGTRTVPKIVAALEVCLNNAIKGDSKSFIKVMEFAQKFKLLEPSPHEPEEISEIQITIVDPQISDKPMLESEYNTLMATSAAKPDS